MAVICVSTSSPDFKRLLEKTSFSEGTLKSIIHEYQNTPSLWEAGQGMWPSDDYVMNYFNRKFIGSPAQISVWKGRFMTPHVYNTYQEAATERQEASKWFDDIDITTYEDDNGNWVNQVARPIDVEETRKNSSKWLQDLQKDIDVTVNTGAYGRYIPKKNEPWKNVPAMNYLGKRLDNFYRQHGLRVKAYWSDNNKKWMVTYAKEERAYVEDITGGITDWTEGQKNAIKVISAWMNDASAGKFMLLEGPAGSGKTSIINEILTKVRPRQRILIGALSHQAKGVLSSKLSKQTRTNFFVEAKSLAGMFGMKQTTKMVDGEWVELFEPDKYSRRAGIPIQGANIVIIDEASMVSEEHMYYIEDLMAHGTKVLFIGDQRQLPPIRTKGSEFYKKHPELVGSEADSPVFTRTDIPRVSLTERVRQGEDSPIHAVTDQFGNYTLQGGQFPTLEGVQSSKDLRLVVETGTADLVQQMVPLFQEGVKTMNPNYAKIVASTNVKGRGNIYQYNKAVHFALHPEMFASNDMNFAVGELVTLYNNYKQGDAYIAYNSENGIVKEVSGTYTMTTSTGHELRYRSYTIKFHDGREEIMPVLEQDAENINNFNKALAQLKQKAQDEGGGPAWRPFYNLKESMADLHFGYASTIHKSQGSTYQVVGVDTTDSFGSARLKSQALYTAMTRAANITIVKGMGNQSAAPSPEAIASANQAVLSKKTNSITSELTPEQIAFIESEVDGVAKIIKDAAVTIARVNLRRAESVVVKNINDYSDGDTTTASSIVKAIVDSPNATDQQKAYAKALMPLLSKMDFTILFATEDNPIIQETNKRHKREKWNAAGSTFSSREAGGGYDIHIKIDVHKNEVIPEKVLLHEITHALTTNRLRNDAEFRRAIDQLSQYVQEWVRTNKDAAQMLSQKYGDFNIPFDIYAFRKYADSGYADFLTEAMSNASFQELLKQIPAPEETQLNTWQKICKLVADAFKNLFSSYYKQGTTVYDLLIPVIADTMTLTSEQYSRNAPYTEWETDRTVQMMANAAEIVKAMNIAIDDKDVHWTTEQLMELLGGENKPNIANIRFFSGGAEGSDIEWGKAINSMGGTIRHFTVQDYDGLSQKDKDELEKKYQEVREALGYKEAKSDYSKKLLRRDIMQVSKAKEVFAVGTFDPNTQIVQGGTVYAVTRAITDGKEVHLFNQADNKWYFYEPAAGAWWEEETPTITQDSAVVGTREITAEGINAISNVLQKSFGNQQPSSQSSSSTGGEKPIPSLSELKGNTAQYGVEIDPNLIQNYDQWLKEHPNGIVAYRVNKSTFNTPQAVEKGIIGNPFDWQKYGAGKAVEMFYNWLVNGETYDEPLATEEFRNAIIGLLHIQPEDTPILYYKELGYPSHATVIGWAINKINQARKEKIAREQAQGYTDEQAKEAISLLNNTIEAASNVVTMCNMDIKYNRATSATYTELEEYQNKLEKLQALLDGLNTGKSEIIINQYGVPQVVEKKQAEKPIEKNIVVDDAYELSPVETKKEGYSQGVVLRKKNLRATAKQGAEQIENLIEQGKLPLGTLVMWQGLNTSELAALNKVNGLNKNEDGSWTVGYTEREIMLKKQNDTLLNSPMFGSHELHKLAAVTMFKLSETITQLQDGSVKLEDILMDESLTDDLHKTDFKGMDRIDIINAIGLDKLFKDVIRESVFNKNINTTLKKDRNLSKKAKIIYDNFDAFIRLGYQELIDLENISIDTERAVQTETDSKKDENGEDLTDEEVVALFGSTVEHWQVGFRQVSTFSSLSKLMRQYLNRLYVLDKEGNRVTDEYGVEQNIDAHEAVSKVLKWTQGAIDIDDMITKLEHKVAQEPWVQQLIDLLNADGNEQLRSQFFSNFKKYFQKYNIIYKEKTKTGGTVTRVKTINRDPFVLSTLDMISSLDNSKEMGSFNLWNPRTNSIDSAAVGSLKKGAEALEAIFSFKKGGQSMEQGLFNQKVSDVEKALDSLNIPLPTREVLLQVLESPNVVKGMQQALEGLHKEFLKVPTGKADYKFMNNKTQSNYTRLIEALAPVMGDGLDSVSYEAGKLHYSYVTPSYLSKFVENMKGMRGDVRAFIESEYGNIEGWFRNRRNNANQAGGQGWLNYWLDRMMGDTEEAKQTREKFDHIVVLSDNGTAYAAKSPVQYMTSMLSMYLYDDHGASAYYRIPMMSNKPSEEYIKFDRIKDGYREVITDWLVNKTFAQEINRIRAVNFRNNAPAELEKLRAKESLTTEEQERLGELEEYLKDGNPAKISSFDKNGASFMFMEYLNQYVNDRNSELGKLIRKKINGEKFDPATNESSRFTELLTQAVQDNMDAAFDRFLRNIALEGLIQLSPDMKVIKVNTIQDKLPLGQAKERLEEFFWNDMFASINIMQLLCTDIAYYKNTEDLQKRFAQWHSPGLKGNIKATINGQRVTDDNGNTRSMYIADKIEVSDVVNTLERVKAKVLAQDRFRDNAPAKALMAAQFDKVIDAFKEVNVTDAQAYTSPTGYRKKMAVFGQWTPRDEEVYQKILSGDFTAEDLDVLWQPLKPFVYSQIEKRGFNPYIPTLKMGVQQKNSEYCLILADALMRSVGEQSTLTAIFDFMEESHGLKKDANGNWTGTPLLTGIDTIMFNSAVKTGLMGVLDINDPNLSHDDVVKHLKDMSGINQGEYDDRYVHTIPFEDYSIQQYNPAHFEGEQQMGSQNRVLVFADMPNEIDGKVQTIIVNGKEVTVKDAKIAYFKAIIDNIKRSGAGITEEFDLSNKSKKMRNLAMMRVLQREIAKDSRYGTDLQWACLLDENGEFNIPLSDAIQSDRIQQLLNSIIKNRINKQEIAGGPVVQVSNYGTSSNLSIRFKDADGNELPTLREFYEKEQHDYSYDDFINMMKYEKSENAEEKNLYKNYYMPIINKFNAEVYSKKAGIAYYECYVTAYDPQLYEDFGDGKGGIDMKKIEKANPKLLEMIGYRIPTEAKYSMAPLRIKGFLPKTGGEGIMLPKEITTLSGSDFDVDKMYIMRYQLNRRPNEDIIKEIEDEYKAAKKNGIASRVQPLIKGEIQPRDAADYLILSSWRQKNLKRYTDPTSGKYANDNLIIATQWGILTAGMAEDQVLSSGNFDDVKHVGYMIATMDNGTQYDSASKMNTSALKGAAYTNKYLQYADTQMQFHKQNMVAAKLIGVFAQANVSHAIVGMSDVPAEIQIPEGQGFIMNGQMYKENTRYIVDKEYGLDNATRISSVLAQLLASSVDAVKDPVLNLLNINMDTVNVAVTLVRLGHDLEFIGMFLTHPIIKQLISRHNIEIASGSTNNLMQTLNAMQKELRGKDNKGATLQMKYNYDKGFFTREHTISNRQDNAYKQYRKDMDLTVLELFKKLNNVAEMFRGVVHTTRYNSITSAVGPYAADTMNNRLSDEQFAANPFVTEEMKQAAEGIIFDENGKAISLIQAFRDTSASLERQLLGDNMIQASEEAYKVYKALKGRMGYMSAKMAKEFGRFYMSYYMNMETPLFNLSDSHREEMIDKFPKLFAGNKNKYRNNLFVQAVMLDKDKAGNDILAINTRGLTDTEIQALRSGWADLYTSEREKGIADKDNLAIKLVEYNFFLGSFGFNPKTFMSMTPNNVKLAIPGYKESLTRQIRMTPDRIDNLLIQFMLNTGYTNLGTLKEKEVTFLSGDLLASREFDKEPNGVGLAKMQMNDGTTKWLYVEPISKSPEVKIYFVDKLGGENGQCFEIDPSRKVYEMQSIVRNTEPENASEPQPDGGQLVEPIVDDKPVYQHLMPLLAAVEGGYIMDNPKQNMANLQDRFNKLYNAGQQSFISTATNLSMEVIDRVADVMGVTQEELLSDVQESENKLNLCK